MPNKISNLSDNQLLDQLVMYCPENGRDATRREFSDSLHRYRRVFEAIPNGESVKSLLDVGARLYTASLYCNDLDYAQVSVATKWTTSYTEEELRTSIPNFERIIVDYFDAEGEVFPYADDSFDVVVCSEIIEHLAIDPMHMMSEINRVTTPGGILIITTPNAASFSALKQLLAGQHPYSWSPYNGTSTDRHNREYTINELERLVSASGFAVAASETISRIPLSRKDRLLASWISLPDIVRGKAGVNLDRVGDTSVVVATKTSAVRERFPAWLYYDPKKGR